MLEMVIALLNDEIMMHLYIYIYTMCMTLTWRTRWSSFCGKKSIPAPAGKEKKKKTLARET